MKERNIHISTKKKMAAGCIFLVVSFAILPISRLSPAFSQWYSTRVYPVLVAVIGWLTSIVPFSVSEVLLYVTILVLIVSVIWMILKKTGKKGIYRWLSSLFLFTAVLYFLYVMNCGINYNRTPFTDSSGLEIKEYTPQELQDICLLLTQKVNDMSTRVERDDNGIMKVDASVQEECRSAMMKLGEGYPQFTGYYARPKGLLFSWILSVQQLAGIYSPFTIEANYNSAMTDYHIPFTICHELSHLKGFMQEEEANFISFLACTGSEETAIQYSGYLSGWVYCMNALYRIDYDAWEEVLVTISDEANADLKANNSFWAQYDGRIAEVANQVNDTYLKANGQEDGVESYDLMVDLIVAYYGEK